MDNSIVLEPVKNSIDLSIIEVETIYQFVSPAQVVADKKEVE